MSFLYFYREIRWPIAVLHRFTPLFWVFFMESSLHTNALHINNAAHSNDLLCFNEVYGKSASHTSASLHFYYAVMIVKTALSSPLSVKITHKTPLSSYLSANFHHLMG